MLTAERNARDWYSHLSRLGDSRLVNVCLANFSPALRDDIRTLYAVLPPDLRARLLQVVSRVEAECSLGPMEDPE